MGFKSSSKIEARDRPKGQLKHQLIPCRTPDLSRGVSVQKAEKRREAHVDKQEGEIIEEIAEKYLI